MAQLSDDCFAFGGALMAVEEAQALILERIPPATGAEMVALSAARGRVLAEPLMAPMPLPPFFNAAVDGWAFRHADLTPGAETALTDLQARSTQASLAQVETQHGVEAVRVVLTREADVTRTWDALLEARGEKK